VTLINYTLRHTLILISEWGYDEITILIPVLNFMANYTMSLSVLKVKVKLPVLNYAPRHEDVWGNGSAAPRIL